MKSLEYTREGQVEYMMESVYVIRLREANSGC